MAFRRRGFFVRHVQRRRAGCQSPLLFRQRCREPGSPVATPAAEICSVPRSAGPSVRDGREATSLAISDLFGSNDVAHWFYDDDRPAVPPRYGYHSVVFAGPDCVASVRVRTLGAASSVGGLCGHGWGILHCGLQHTVEPGPLGFRFGIGDRLPSLLCSGLRLSLREGDPTRRKAQCTCVRSDRRVDFLLGVLDCSKHVL
mmetsp:Transcript_35066/g.76758  ORF Transcript_35066/g.76758 Transcript_35066/m.76758 type:complete len:200 (+) Transcript_35066:340-939(+)